MPDEDQMEEARDGARSSVLQDLSDDVRDLTGLIKDLNNELRELTDQNNRRWATNKIVLSVLSVFLVLNILGGFMLRGVQIDLANEIEARAEGNCIAIQTSRDALAAMVNSLRRLSEQPIPEGITDEELLQVIEQSRERNEAFYDDMDQVISNITCRPEDDGAG